MDMNDKMIERVLSRDYSVGKQAFKENLLQRCLAELDQGDQGMELADDELDMLAAAGVPFLDENPFNPLKRP
jgi:hypothetical protein